MKLYISHASDFDYQTQLYEPLKAAFGVQHQLILPHDENAEGVNTKDILPTCDYVLAEVSYPSTGQGIELGRAEAAGVPIVCICNTDATPSGALQYITQVFVTYTDSESMVSVIKNSLRL